jgi:hypothetical protein
LSYFCCCALTRSIDTTTMSIVVCRADASHGPAHFVCSMCKPVVYYCSACDAEAHGGKGPMSKHTRDLLPSAPPCDGVDGCMSPATLECVNCGKLCERCDVTLHSHTSRAIHAPRTRLLQVVPLYCLSEVTGRPTAHTTHTRHAHTHTHTHTHSLTHSNHTSGGVDQSNTLTSFNPVVFSIVTVESRRPL